MKNSKFQFFSVSLFANNVLTFSIIFASNEGLTGTILIEFGIKFAIEKAHEL
ncbi:hypothetical protein MKY37_14010 [Psychrobacillus sp. FSL K6-2836]|uniref:hypothetical protein n=1 Tax=Psychrobacillus sp. FSL K6-2836 TaxID=2921548 RepID=UPI0030F7F4DA